MASEVIKEEIQTQPEPRISVDYPTKGQGKGKWGKVFHLIDRDGNECILVQKDAVAIAHQILNITKEKQ